jgi:hypothetical protein
MSDDEKGGKGQKRNGKGEQQGSESHYHCTATFGFANPGEPSLDVFAFRYDKTVS